MKNRSFSMSNQSHAHIGQGFGLEQNQQVLKHEILHHGLGNTNINRNSNTKQLQNEDDFTAFGKQRNAQKQARLGDGNGFTGNMASGGYRRDGGMGGRNDQNFERNVTPGRVIRESRLVGRKRSFRSSNQDSSLSASNASVKKKKSGFKRMKIY